MGQLRHASVSPLAQTSSQCIPSIDKLIDHSVVLIQHLLNDLNPDPQKTLLLCCSFPYLQNR